MNRPHLGLSSRTRGAVSLATAFAMALGIVAPALAAETATFNGTVIAPDNSFAAGFTVVFKDATTGQEYRSAPTSATGEYQVSVPTGGKYKLDSVTAPDGTKLPVQNVPPIPVRVAGSSKLDVKFTQPAAGAATGTAVAAGAAAGAAAGTSGAAAPTTAAAKPASTSTQTAAAKPAEDQKKKKDGEVPWWKRPGPITGIVLGSLAVVAIAVSAGGGSDNPPPISQSLP